MRPKPLYKKTPLLNLPSLRVDFTLACFLPSEQTWKLILLVLLEFMLCLWMAWIEHDVGVLFFLPYGWIVEFKYLHANPHIKNHQNLCSFVGHDHAQTTWTICKHGQNESWNIKWWCMTCSKCWRIQKLLQNAMHGKQFTIKWWDTHYDLKASWRLQNSMHHTILTRHILTKITAYRGLRAHHFVEVIGRGILW